MEFWGVEVKPGEQLKLQPDHGKLIHISQAALGEVHDAKGAQHVPLRMKIDGKPFIIGTLSADRAQLMFDFVFEKNFELSHDWKNGSVYFMGYTVSDTVSDDEESSDESEDDESEDDESEDEPLVTLENGDIKSKDLAVAKIVSKKDEVASSDEDEDASESDSDDDNELLPQKDESIDVSLDESEDDSDESFSSEDELPKVTLPSKKRPVQPAQATPFARRAKSAAPVKTGNTKDHKAAPLPSKTAGRNPMNNNSQKKQKFGGPKARK